MREAERRSAADSEDRNARAGWGRRARLSRRTNRSSLPASVSKETGGDPGVPRPTSARAARSARVEATRNACARPPESRVAWRREDRGRAPDRAVSGSAHARGRRGEGPV